jgi:glycosyltransferase involved in cell wall biosynthesis
LALRVRYNTIELATAVKPWVFQKLFEEGHRHAVYLDPDVYLFGPITEVLDLLERGSNAVLTPHITRPLPRDGCKPDDLEILRTGIYNLGFLALRNSEEVAAFLGWWRAWLRTNCFSVNTRGEFTDQKWLNFANVLWNDFAVLRHPGYNLAYWNLHERTLSRDQSGRWLSEAEPLVFFHFSGFNPLNPSELSKYQDRFRVDPGSPLSELLGQYAAKLLELGAEQSSAIPVPVLRFADGAGGDSIVAEIFHKETDAGTTFSALDGPGQFREFLHAVRPGERYPNYVEAVLNRRQDVRWAYSNASMADLALWLRKHGTKELGLDASLAGSFAPRHAHLRFNYVGYLQAELGVGEAARGYLRALTARGYAPRPVDASFLTVHRPNVRAFHGTDVRRLPSAPLNILHLDIGDMVGVLEVLGAKEAIRDSYNVGIWAWETQELPEEWSDRFRFVNEVWTGSRFMADAIGRKAPVPVLVIPHVVEVPRVLPDRAAFGLADDEFTFLFTFDYCSTTLRKNPAACIRAFKQAFRPDDKVRLVVKSLNAGRFPELEQRLRAEGHGARVSFLDRSLESLERYRLISSCDAYVSLHRAEGFGLAMAEAMAYGKPVIATGWSGNMEFMSPVNSLPVAYELRPLDEDAAPYKRGTVWAEPDLADAAGKMRSVWEDPALRASISERAARDIAAHLSSEAIGGLMAGRLEWIAARLETRPFPPSGRLVRRVASDPLRAAKRIPRAVQAIRFGGASGLRKEVLEFLYGGGE